MNLLLDLGNTRLKSARLQAGALADTCALAHADADFERQWDAWLSALSSTEKVIAWLAPVAPDAMLTRVERMLHQHGIEIRRVRPQAQALGLRMAYTDPSTLGVDRWLGLLAARARAADSALVVSVGSALTVDAITADGRHLGGVIAPPPDAMRSALIARAPRLDVAGGEVQRFATSTPDAIRSGCVLAAAALIERNHAELAHISAATPRLWLSGGGAETLRAWIPPHEFVPWLVLEGLANWVTAQTR